MDQNDATVLKALLDGFTESFDQTLSLVDELIAATRAQDEILILMTARLDALATATNPETRGNREAFEHMLDSFSGQRARMHSISVPDLYGSLLIAKFMASGWVESPGWVRMWSRQELPALQLIDASGIPIEVKAVEKFFETSAAVLRKQFRVRPRQRKSRPSFASLADVEAALTSNLRDIESQRSLGQAFRPFISLHAVGSLGER